MVHAHHHQHAHAHASASAEHQEARGRALRIALWLNLIFLVVEVVVGFASNSLALLGDAAHMGTDVAALVLAIAAERLAVASGGPGHTFGYRRAPTLAAFGNALTMLVLGGVLIFEALHRLQAPPAIPAIPVLVAGTAGLVVNVVSAVILHRQAGHSHNLRGAMLHMMGDALGSVGVIVSALVIWWTGWQLIDPLVTMGIAGLILLATWPLLRDATRTLLQVSPIHVDVDELRDGLMEYHGVTCVEDLHAWELDAGFLIVTAALHVDCDQMDDLEELRRVIREDLFHEWGASHVTLELIVENDHPELPERPCIAGL
ncbi:MAG: cation diffusion facilitator family transporter [Myxococcota bacterium]